jgi:hypothetical protein
MNELVAAEALPELVPDVPADAPPMEGGLT